MSTTETKPRQILIHYDRAQLSLGDAATTDDASAWLANLAGLLAQEFGARVSLASVGTRRSCTPWSGTSRIRAARDGPCTCSIPTDADTRSRSRSGTSWSCARSARDRDDLALRPLPLPPRAGVAGAPALPPSRGRARALRPAQSEHGRCRARRRHRAPVRGSAAPEGPATRLPARPFAPSTVRSGPPSSSPRPSTSAATPGAVLCPCRAAAHDAGKEEPRPVRRSAAVQAPVVVGEVARDRAVATPGDGTAAAHAFRRK